MGTCSVTGFEFGDGAGGGGAYSEPGTTLGSQLVAATTENGVGEGLGEGVGEGVAGVMDGADDAVGDGVPVGEGVGVDPADATASAGLALCRVWLGDGERVAAPHAATSADTSRALAILPTSPERIGGFKISTPSWARGRRDASIDIRLWMDADASSGRHRITAHPSPRQDPRPGR